MRPGAAVHEHKAPRDRLRGGTEIRAALPAGGRDHPDDDGGGDDVVRLHAVFACNIERAALYSMNGMVWEEFAFIEPGHRADSATLPQKCRHFQISTFRARIIRIVDLSHCIRLFEMSILPMHDEMSPGKGNLF